MLGHIRGINPRNMTEYVRNALENILLIREETGSAIT
jgi:hypothetical protein